MKNKKYKKDLVERELSLLPGIATRFAKEVERSVRKNYKALGKEKDIKLWLTPANEERLLTWKVWSIKYRVSLDYIVMTLVPFWEGFLSRVNKTRRRQVRGFGVNLGTLTGKKSLSVLLETIRKDYPNNLNHTEWIAREKERLYKLNENKYKDEFEVKSKSLIDYSTPLRYVKAYRRRMKEIHRQRERFAEQMKLRNYRTNPFTKGLV